jgi:hypothetical protein
LPSLDILTPLTNLRAFDDIEFTGPMESTFTDDIVVLPKQYRRYGYRRVTALLHSVSWSMNHKRVERI